MKLPRTTRLGYVLKCYPRYSETFIVNEILAHEAAGWSLDIFALRPCHETHYQDRIAKVRAGVIRIPTTLPKPQTIWQHLRQQADRHAGVWDTLRAAPTEDPETLYQALRLAEEIENRGITHLHAHFATVATSVARLAAAITGITYSFTAHAKDIFHESVDPGDLQRKIDDAAAIITVSDFNRAYLRDQYRLREERLYRIYNGMDLSTLQYVVPARRPPTLLGVGRLVEKKGFDVLIRACGLLHNRGVNFRCEILGSGEQEASLRGMVRELGLATRVLLAGPRPQAEVFAAVQGAAALAVPCIVGRDGNRDGLPTVILEAMALGTPVIATDVTGIPEVVRDGETGWIVASQDACALADALETCLADPAERMQRASRARTLIEQEFDSVETAARIRDVFRESIEPAGAWTQAAALQETT